MSVIETRSMAEQLRREGMTKLRVNALEEAIHLFDEASAHTADSEMLELIGINKSRALIQMGVAGPEVQKLPQIIMRRANPRHVSLAAFSLQYKFRIEGDYSRAAMYGRIALDAANEIGEQSWVAAILLELGNIAIFDSRNKEAISHYEDALGMIDVVSDPELTRAIIYQNLGYCRMLEDDVDGGLSLIHEAIGLMIASGAEGYLAESYIDLCFGYLENESLDKAREFGTLGLELATEDRQVRNAHYLLGEVAYKSGDTVGAQRHFGHLSRFYPDFPHLTDLLLAIDLRSMVNLKLS
jgi:tetratricopeptide (TPR) repeat protein